MKPDFSFHAISMKLVHEKVLFVCSFCGEIEKESVSGGLASGLLV